MGGDLKLGTQFNADGGYNFDPESVDKTLTALKGKAVKVEPLKITNNEEIARLLNKDPNNPQIKSERDILTISDHIKELKLLETGLENGKNEAQQALQFAATQTSQISLTGTQAQENPLITQANLQIQENQEALDILLPYLNKVIRMNDHYIQDLTDNDLNLYGKKLDRLNNEIKQGTITKEDAIEDIQYIQRILQNTAKLYYHASEDAQNNALQTNISAVNDLINQYQERLEILQKEESPTTEQQTNEMITIENNIPVTTPKYSQEDLITNIHLCIQGQDFKNADGWINWGITNYPNTNLASQLGLFIKASPDKYIGVYNFIVGELGFGQKLEEEKVEQAIAVNLDATEPATVAKELLLRLGQDTSRLSAEEYITEVLDQNKDSANLDEIGTAMAKVLMTAMRENKNNDDVIKLAQLALQAINQNTENKLYQPLQNITKMAQANIQKAEQETQQQSQEIEQQSQTRSFKPRTRRLEPPAHSQLISKTEKALTSLKEDLLKAESILNLDEVFAPYKAQWKQKVQNQGQSFDLSLEYFTAKLEYHARKLAIAKKMDEKPQDMSQALEHNDGDLRAYQKDTTKYKVTHYQANQAEFKALEMLEKKYSELAANIQDSRNYVKICSSYNNFEGFDYPTLVTAASDTGATLEEKLAVELKISTFFENSTQHYGDRESNLIRAEKIRKELTTKHTPIYRTCLDKISNSYIKILPKSDRSLYKTIFFSISLEELAKATQTAEQRNDLQKLTKIARERISELEKFIITKTQSYSRQILKKIKQSKDLSNSAEDIAQLQKLGAEELKIILKNIKETDDNRERIQEIIKKADDIIKSIDAKKL